MKKPTNETASRRKLVLRREAIAKLTSVQLDNVVGGIEEADGGSRASGCCGQSADN